MKKLMTIARRFRDDDNGAAMVEYTILIGIITVSVIAAVLVVGGWVGTQWTNLDAALTP